ncbi:MAG: hypothetical protein ACHQ7M_15915, partial [Chloroflexota bacterium]
MSSAGAPPAAANSRRRSQTIVSLGLGLFAIVLGGHDLIFAYGQVELLAALMTVAGGLALAGAASRLIPRWAEPLRIVGLFSAVFIAGVVSAMFLSNAVTVGPITLSWWSTPIIIGLLCLALLMLWNLVLEIHRTIRHLVRATARIVRRQAFTESELHRMASRAGIAVGAVVTALSGIGGTWYASHTTPLNSEPTVVVTIKAAQPIQ